MSYKQFWKQREETRAEEMQRYYDTYKTKGFVVMPDEKVFAFAQFLSQISNEICEVYGMKECDLRGVFKAEVATDLAVALSA